MKKTASFFLILLLIAGCQGNLLKLRPDRGDQGEVYIYLKPLNSDTGEQGLHISGILAVGIDGVDHPLTISISDLRSNGMKRQRLVASGMVPPGLFSAIRFSFVTSSAREEEGKSPAAETPEEVVVDVRFQVSSRQAVVLSGTFGMEESSDEVPSPSFKLSVPRSPLPGFAGYVSNTDSGTVTVFDKRQMEATNVLVVGGEPRGIAVDQPAGRLYVALSEDNSVAVIETISQESLGRALLRPGDEPSEMGIVGDGRTVLVANYGSDSVSFIDALALTETDRVLVGNGPYSVLVDDAGRRAYVFNSLSNSISVLDIGARAVVATIAVGIEPLRGAFSPRGDLIYVIHKRYPYILVIDSSSFATVQRIYAGGIGVNALEIDRRSGLIYVAKRQESMVEIFAPAGNLPVGFVITEGAVENMALDEEENRLYLAIPGKSDVALVNLINRRPISAVDTGGTTYAVDVMATTKARNR